MAEKSEHGVFICSMPWADWTMPSIQVGSLVAFLNQGHVRATGAHWFLDIAQLLGRKTYSLLSQPFLETGESLYSFLLFPELRQRLLENEQLLEKARLIASLEQPGQLPFTLSQEFFDAFEACHQELLDQYDWAHYVLAGFTLNYGQTMGSLYIARCIKDRNPLCRIIFGGAEVSGSLGASLLEQFNEVDYCCNGEGEQLLLNLSRYLLQGASNEQISTLGGLICRNTDGSVFINEPHQLSSLDVLPTPDYGSYFDSLKSDTHLPTAYLPIEGSRGCYFSCSFCSVSASWTNTRSRNPDDVCRDITVLSEKYQILDFFFVDNVTPQNAEKIFDCVARLPLDIRFFFELRANTPRSLLRKMASAGLVRAQVGIEALSTSLLRTFDKRSRFITNLQIMKNCRELNIEMSANLIIDHPASTDDHVSETIHNMRVARCFPPPDMFSTFALQVGSRDFATNADNKIRVQGNSSHYKMLYPDRLFDTLDLPAKRYERLLPKADWSRLNQWHADWQRSYRETTLQLSGGYMLSFMDGGPFLRIEDFRDGEAKVYILDGLARHVMLAVDQVKSLKGICLLLPEEDPQNIESILNELVALDLVYREDHLFLGLPIHRRRLPDA